MKFRFCGELDCPDWVLAEIATLSKITSIKMKMLCTQVVNSILGSPIDFGKVEKMTSDAKYDVSDIKASIAALTYILTSAAKHGVEEDSLSNELQQLGLPKESTAALGRVLSDKFLPLQMKLRQESMKTSEIKEVNYRTDYILSSNMLINVDEPSVILGVQVKDHITTQTTNHCFSMTAQKAQLLLHELKMLLSSMEELSAS